MADPARGPRTVVNYDPGSDAAARYPDWVIRHRPLRGIPEVMCLERRVILIDEAQGWPAKRSGLAHAIAHLDLGHVVIGGHLGTRQEQDAEQLAALRLIHPTALADAIQWCGQRWTAVAEHLTVDERLLHLRLRTMHPNHRHLVRDHLADHLLGETA